MTLQTIHSLDDPRLLPYRQLKHTNLTRWSGRFIAEGEKVVQRLLLSGYRVESILLSEARLELSESLNRDDVDLLIVSQSLAEELVGYRFHAGVLACGVRGSAPELMQLPEPLHTPTILMACDRVTDPDNLGTIIRLCTAFGAEGLILGPGCADPFTRRTLRVSMGNAFSLPIVEASDLRSVLMQLRGHGLQLFPAMLHPASRPLHQIAKPQQLILLFGNEAQGLAEHWVENSDGPIMIPMSGQTDSLNVAIAAGIILHYFARLAKA